MSKITGNPNEDFFDQNPGIDVIGVFKEVRNIFNKNEASKICWAIYMLEDLDSKLYNMPRDDRIKEINDNYYKLDFDNLHIQNLMLAYPFVCMDKEKSMFKIHMDKLDALTMHYKKLDLENDKEFERYMKIADKLPKMWDAMDKIKDRMFKAEAKNNQKGSVHLSASEKRRR